MIYPSLRPEAISQKLIADLIEQERRLLTELPSYYAVIVARPRRGFSKMIASLNYFLVPKLKRVGRELRQRMPASRRKAARG